MSNIHKTDKHYISDIDIFLCEFDDKHPEKSSAQQQEISKYQKIDALRDQFQEEETETSLWKGF